MRLPYATKTSAFFSGIVLAIMLSAGEYFGGWLYLILNLTGALWFPVSIAIFVHGRQEIDYRIEALSGRRSHYDFPREMTPRALIWFCTTLVAAWALSLWSK